MEDFKNKMPEGLGFSMAMNEKAMENFGRMTEEQRDKVIAESRQVSTKYEMNELVDRIASNNF